MSSIAGDLQVTRWFLMTWVQVPSGNGREYLQRKCILQTPLILQDSLDPARAGPQQLAPEP
ncbi:Hypothetical predicted protein, partial [Marmota monax]